MSRTHQSTEAYPVLAAVYGAVLKEWLTLVLLLLAAGPHREPGHRKVRDCEQNRQTAMAAIESASTAVSLLF